MLVNTSIKNVFFKIVEISLPRILGLCDRNFLSKTYGCFDRNYWHVKILDFPNIRFQEAALVLALIYKNKIIDNFFQKEKIRLFAVGAVNFAFSRQNKDGSFNEGYPFDRSFAATSFAGYALTQTIMLLELDGWEDNIIKLGSWLSRNNHPEVSNQMAGAANALYNIYLITNNKIYKKASQNKIHILYKNKTNNQFLPEYGGADIGYLSIALSNLSDLWKKSKDDLIYQIANDSAVFINNHLDEFGRFDWKKMSRKTQYVYPYGFTVLKIYEVVMKLANGLKQNLILNPLWMDDRYCIPFALDYLMAVLQLREDNASAE